jgi:hypothetical protein
MATLGDLFAVVTRGRRMQSISCGYGKMTFSTASVTLAGFVVEAPFIRTLTSKKLQKVGSTNRTPVSAHPDIDGWLFQDTVEVEDGTVCMVQMSYKYRGSGLRDGAIFIRTRKNGRGLLITAKLPSDPRSILSSNRHTVFAGAGDILTVEELNALGIEPNGNFVRAFMDPEEVEECFDILVTGEEKEAPPIEETHTTAEGEQVKLRIDRTPRRMRIRR